ncbi:uncharacterized protein Pyn_15177 [Prunus yedoensis var. nudiflora]|uniref:Uncharacterized protein n=1 Tax=Prunus yedoensis var. nudiflora TaxID=2094558 RepID=A0A314Y8J6_PRUYE|nr:uncharacterized protein Pyn_15177 [Prunus yedoensis var. nudiflora]
MVEGEGTDAKIASLVQQMEKMTLMMAKLVEDLARKPQDEIPEDSRRKTSRTKTSKVKKRMQFSEEEDSDEEEEFAEEFGANQSQEKESDADKAKFRKKPLIILPRRQLVNRLYVSLPEVLPTELAFGMMSQWTHTLDMLVRNYLNPTSQHGKVSWKAAHILFQLVIEQSVSIEFYVRESLIVIGATNATVPTASLVLPQVITALVAHASVPTLSTDDIGSSNTIKVNNQVTLHRSDAHCTSGSFSIEEQALLDSFSASHQVTHVLLHRIWNHLDTYGELLLTLDGHIQPTDPPRSTQARIL